MTYRHWKDSGRGRRVTEPQKEQLTSWIPIWYRRIMRQPPQTPCPPVSCPLSVRRMIKTSPQVGHRTIAAPRGNVTVWPHVEQLMCPWSVSVPSTNGGGGGGPP